MSPRVAVKLLLVLTLGLPVVAAVLVWVAGLLKAMGDPAGAAIVGSAGTVCNVIWLISLVGLLITLALLTLDERSSEEP